MRLLLLLPLHLLLYACSLPGAAALDSQQVLELFRQASSAAGAGAAQQHDDVAEGDPAGADLLAMFEPLAERLTEQGAQGLLQTAICNK
jgi:hypothetical protein